MKTVRNILEMSEISLKEIISGRKTGFVPTMGALHEGHLSLVKAARSENDTVTVSIFVNPIQFGPAEDFGVYPRPIARDTSLLEAAGVDYLFLPSAEDMYGNNFETYIDLERLPGHLCGLRREGHFRGVATVVAKLFNIIKPNKAYFGQKDYQQALIIRKMAADLNFTTEIKTVPIIREQNGLALSSRNRYLTEKQKTEASSIYKALRNGEKLILEGERNAGVIIQDISGFISNNITNSKIDYVSAADPDTLVDIDIVNDGVLLAAAVYIGTTRLIDNILVKINKD
jgi:pantoate--beta-alanine ligase